MDSITGMETVKLTSKDGRVVEVTFPVTREEFEASSYMKNQKTRQIEDTANFMCSEILFAKETRFDLTGRNSLHTRFIRTPHVDEVVQILQRRLPDARFELDNLKGELLVLWENRCETCNVLVRTGAAYCSYACSVIDCGCKSDPSCCGCDK